jgi:hypothetical protein
MSGSGGRRGRQSGSVQTRSCRSHCTAPACVGVHTQHVVVETWTGQSQGPSKAVWWGLTAGQENVAWAPPACASGSGTRIKRPQLPCHTQLWLGELCAPAADSPAACAPHTLVAASQRPAGSRASGRTRPCHPWTWGCHMESQDRNQHRPDSVQGNNMRRRKREARWSKHKCCTLALGYYEHTIMIMSTDSRRHHQQQQVPVGKGRTTAVCASHHGTMVMISIGSSCTQPSACPLSRAPRLHRLHPLEADRALIVAAGVVGKAAAVKHVATGQLLQQKKGRDKKQYKFK